MSGRLFVLVLTFTSVFLTCAPSPVLAECAAFKNGQRFRVLNAVEGFRDHFAPNFPGAQRIASLGFSRLWSPGESQQDIPKVATIAQKASDLRSAEIIYVDIEVWPVAGRHDDEIRASLQKYEQAMLNVRSALGPVPCLGYYGVIPVVDFSRVISGDPKRLEAWHHENDLISPLAQRVDYVAPSLYTLTTDFKVWKAFAKAQIAEARRIAPGKPVMPFLWPRYHDGFREHALEPLPASYVAAQLRYVAACADGVILWEWGANKQFDDKSPWVPVFRQFASSTSNAVVRRVCD